MLLCTPRVASVASAAKVPLGLPCDRRQRTIASLVWHVALSSLAVASIAYTCHPAGLALFQTLRRGRESLRQGRASQFGSWRAERGATGASGTLSPGRGSLSHRWPNLAGTIDGIAHLVIVHAAVVNQCVVACLQTSKDSVGSKASDGKRKKPQAGTNTRAHARRHPSQRCTHARCTHARTRTHAQARTYRLYM